ncbi:MAG: Tyrosine-tRNA ligase [candidate division WS6 bacterium GW2011_GWA2_37_6]|uniref:tyrosine--tRNA ligase n=1 Tax=candidate division WS6 bacterium GW2011_GWA2_37_6 TaxID=1619087 RepID=A0A0G0K6Q3_9BACT|nr:MAG: Tyrosine-tRNA ligase [candidate division WS6 bacterium GW2011_GWA2_37_6]
MLTKKEIGSLLKNITIVKVLSIEKHPNADRLVLVNVEMESGKTKQVVTGASNMKAGDLVPFLSGGHVVPGYLILHGKKIVLEPKDLRGVVSDSMILAEDEIGLSEDHTKIYVLEAKDEKLVGKSITEVLTKEQVEQIYQNSGLVELTPELKEKIELIKSIATNGGEIVGEEELPSILRSNEKLYTYDGFEPSGQMHIAQGIIRAINTNKMIKAGFTFRMWVADWFGYLNNKMDGDMEKIQIVGKYFIEIWKAAGMDLDHVEFLWTSDFIGKKEYWETVMRVAKHTTLKRMLRTTEIMGRKENDELSAAQIIYPCMQFTDIFKVMKCQVTQLGLDQRKVNMLARELGPELGFWKPVVVSHGLLKGLNKPVEGKMDATERAIAMKMSKSKPDTAIFMTDTKEDVERKIQKAYCPEGEIDDNPILDYCKQIIFEAHHLKGQEGLLKDGFTVKRDQKFGGDVTYKIFSELEADYKTKKLFPLDLKVAVADYLNKLIEPVRKHFEQDKKAKALLEQVQSFQITR